MEPQSAQSRPTRLFADLSLNSHCPDQEPFSMFKTRNFVTALAFTLLGLTASAMSSGTPDTSTSFEFSDFDPAFTVGTAPYQLTFAGGFADSIGDFSIYHTGFFAWMIQPGGTGLATFDTPAKEIQFFARTQNAATTGVVTVFGTDGSVLGTFNPDSTGWTQVTIPSAVPQVSHFTVQHTGGAGLIAIDTLDYCANDTGRNWCFGDGGDQAGCSDCPCMNNATEGSVGGCLNSGGAGSRLIATGSTSVSLAMISSADLRFSATDGPAFQLFILNSGDDLAPNNPANPCFGLDSGVGGMLFDGLRCVVAGTLRNGGRGADSNGEVGVTNAAWGGSDNPPGGIAQFFGYTAGTTKFFQSIHRDSTMVNCSTGLNTTQAIEILFTP